jgi:hypothetical protein
MELNTCSHQFLRTGDRSLLSSVPPSKYLNCAFKEATITHFPQVITCSDLPFHTELPATHVATAVSRNEFVVGYCPQVENLFMDIG